ERSEDRSSTEASATRQDGASASAGAPSDPRTDDSSGPDEAHPALAATPSASLDANRPVEPTLFFGDLHVNTALSFDAFESGVRTEPADAYRFARGEKIAHAVAGEIALSGPPLDFLAVTDHAEYLGVTTARLRESHPLHRQPLIQSWRSQEPERVELATRRIRQTLQSRSPLPALVADDVLVSAWQESIAAANAHDRPGVFTAFVAFEYSSNPGRQNLHRNVIFRGGKVPRRPFSAFDSEDPEALWDWMDAARATGDDLLAIPHNANGSNGLMFAPARFDGGEIDADWARQRIRNEPLAELIQIKGQSETTPRLSPDDAWADFEVVPWQTLTPSAPSRESGSYVREAQGRGLALRETLGVDPFAIGVIGSTDTHNSASPIDEARYFGKIGDADGTPAARLERTRPRDALGTGAGQLNVSAYWSAAGLAGVWASENSRAALFDAMRRRETFATSGPRIRVRVRAGFETDGAKTANAADAEGADAAAQAVPMGGVLRSAPGATSPRFELLAQQDPLEAPLERLQIIKLWRTADGQSRERIYDAACRDGAPPDPASHRCASAARAPDPARCAIDPAAGARELSVLWRDPDFDPKQAALYSVRVLQVPTCRWSTFDAKSLGQAPPPELPATIQERAITSPIWVLPDAGRRPGLRIPSGRGGSSRSSPPRRIR
ncbi:DUF3604 domain-containing protein, partial [Myxococcota bacterium]|nr:DUF3604 domain-containing protein [Myxococcota bacterium]